MTIYVDDLYDWGMKYWGRMVQTCHMITDRADLTELHEMATELGLRRYFQDNHESKPHYDLMASKRERAIELGAIEVKPQEIVRILRARWDAIIIDRLEGRGKETPPVDPSPDSVLS